MNNSFIVDNSSLRLGMEFTKVDSERRIVSGIATLNNVDAHGDLITAEASKEAFTNFRGNIREMHGDKAVGKLVNFSEVTLGSGDDTYDGIMVDVYISKAEEEVWTKIQERIFSGFSIGGRILERGHKDDEEYRDKGVTGSVITKYELFELSIVDNPANPLANVMAISKSKDGGLIENTEIINVYKKDGMVLATRSDNVPEGFEFVKWIEDTPEEMAGTVEEIAKSHDVSQLTTPTVNYYFGAANGQHMLWDETSSSWIVKTAYDNKIYTTTEGGNTMADDVEKTVDAEEPVVEAAAEELEKDVEETVEENEELAKDVSEETEEEAVVEKAFDLDELIAKFKEVSDAAQAEIVKTVEDLKGSFSDALDAVKGELSDRLAEVEDKVSSVENRVESVEDDTATRKSVDGSAEDRTKDNIWANSPLIGVNGLLDD